MKATTILWFEELSSLDIAGILLKVALNTKILSSLGWYAAIASSSISLALWF
jgi:hypothetical protein